jgi:MFS family permease
MDTKNSGKENNSTPKRSGIFYGWKMAFAGLGIGFYQDGTGHYGFTVFFDQILMHFPGWPQWAVSIGPSLQRLNSGILAPVTGYMVDHWGSRRTLILGFMVGGLAFILLGLIQNMWQFYVVLLILAFGSSAGSYVVATAAVSNWFSRMRGRAISIVVLGPGLSGILAAVWVPIIDWSDWRTACFIAGVGFWVFCIPLAMVMRSRPEDYGLSKDGDEITEKLDYEQPFGTKQTNQDIVMSMHDILRSRSYWQYVAFGALALGTQSGLVLFLMPALKSYGISMAASGVIVMWFTVSSIPIRLLSGVLADRFDKRLVIAVAMVLQVLGVMAFASVTNTFMAFVAAFMIGSAIGLRNPARLALQAEYWGTSVFGRVGGIQMGVAAIPGIITPMFVGLVFDMTGSYRLAFFVLAGITSIAIPLVLTLKRPSFPTGN